MKYFATDRLIVAVKYDHRLISDNNFLLSCFYYVTICTELQYVLTYDYFYKQAGIFSFSGWRIIKTFLILLTLLTLSHKLYDDEMPELDD